MIELLQAVWSVEKVGPDLQAIVDVDCVDVPSQPKISYTVEIAGNKGSCPALNTQPQLYWPI